MVDAIVSKITNVVRSTVRALGDATRTAPWLTAAVILAIFLVW
jgi:hypothetical protein